MKLNFVLLLVILYHFTVAQDTIFRKNRTKIISKVTSIDSIYIQIINLSDSMLYYLPIESIDSIRYLNGSIQRFKDNSIANLKESNNSHLSNMQYKDGVLEAYSFYSYDNDAMIYTGVIFGPLGIFLPAIASLTNISRKEIRVTEHNKLKQNSFINGYLFAAKKIRRREIWKGYALGSCIFVTLYGAIIGAILISEEL